MGVKPLYSCKGSLHFRAPVGDTCKATLHSYPLLPTPLYLETIQAVPLPVGGQNLPFTLLKYPTPSIETLEVKNRSKRYPDASRGESTVFLSKNRFTPDSLSYIYIFYLLLSFIRRSRNQLKLLGRM